MRATVLYGPRDIRFEDREAPRIEEPTDAPGEARSVRRRLEIGWQTS
jgi:hypothetical protein